MNPQNIVRAAFAAIAVVSCGVVVVDHHKTVKSERAKREQIKLNTQRELLALARANLTVQRKVLAGHYDKNFATAVTDIRSDMTFYRIIDRFDEN
jgi:hypothetical protein